MSGLVGASIFICSMIMAVHLGLVDIYVVWHPEDEEGCRIAKWLLDHFHGTPYSGLVGGLIEVYTRSAPWRIGSDTPRAMPFQEPSQGDSEPRFSVVVPVIGVHMARAVENTTSGWRRYLASVSEAAQASENIGVFPIQLPGCGGAVDELLDSFRALAPENASDSSVLCREIAQQITQMIGDEPGSQLTVFCSYTQ